MPPNSAEDPAPPPHLRPPAAAHRARLEARDRARAERRAATPRARSGRKSTYSPARAKAVCDLIAQGCTCREIGRLPGLPSLSTIHFWLRRQPDFRPLYAEACRRRDLMLDFELWLVAEKVNPINFVAMKREAATIEKRMSDCAPMVWW